MESTEPHTGRQNTDHVRIIVLFGAGISRPEIRAGSALARRPGIAAVARRAGPGHRTTITVYHYLKRRQSPPAIDKCSKAKAKPQATDVAAAPAAAGRRAEGKPPGGGGSSSESSSPAVNGPHGHESRLFAGPARPRRPGPSRPGHESPAGLKIPAQNNTMILM